MQILGVRDIVDTGKFLAEKFGYWEKIGQYLMTKQHIVKHVLSLTKYFFIDQKYFTKFISGLLPNKFL